MLPRRSFAFPAGGILGGLDRLWIMRGARFLFWPLSLLTLVALALQLGAWQKEFKISGPFAVESDPPRHALVLDVPQEGRAAWWRQPLLGDDNGNPYRSFLELWIDGREVGPAHSLHEMIRSGTTTGFSHWGSRVIFSLLPGVKNAPETIATLRYKVRPRAWVIFALAVSSALLGRLLYGREFRSLARRYGDIPAAFMLRAPYLILFWLFSVGLFGSAVYVASSLYAFMMGWALPTTAIIRWSTTAQWAARNEPYLGYLLLTVGGYGAAATWLAGSNPRRKQLVEFGEFRLRRVFLWFGLPIVACTFLFSMSAMWCGILRPGDLNSNSIGGLIPFNDAVAYFGAANDQAKDGIWQGAAVNRPLASAFRSALTLFANYSYSTALILQACMVATAAWFAAISIMRWRGVWAGVAFFALTYIYDRVFVPTTLTEPLGLFWALLSVPFFVNAFRSGCVKSAFIAFTMTCVALMTRMGSMFTIPALIVWLVWQFGRGAAAKTRLALLALGIFVAVLGLNRVLEKAYVGGQNSTAQNFSYVACGLAIGTTWDGCPAKLAKEGTPLPSDQAEAAKQLYKMAWASFQSQPYVFFNRLLAGLTAFAWTFSGVMWTGYVGVKEPEWLWHGALLATSFVGLGFLVTRRSTRVELSLWLLLWLSILLSASIVFLDDGSRIMAASHPLIAMFFAMGMTSPALSSTETFPANTSFRYGALGLIIAAVTFVTVPWIAFHFNFEKTQWTHKDREALVLGGHRLSGFLVVDDSQPLHGEVPMVHFSDFAAIIEQSGVEEYQGLLHPQTPPLPFGFVFAVRIEKDALSYNQFIVPADVLERHDVPRWHFEFKPWNSNLAGYYWFYVTKAEPWGCRASVNESEACNNR